MTAFPGFPQDVESFSADEVGQALAGLIARDSGGLPVVGMLAPPVVSVVAATWKVQVGKFVYVHQVNGAVQFSGLSAAEQVTLDTAAGIPAGQSRIDRVCWDPVTAMLEVVKGVPAVSPVAPSIGTRAPVGRQVVVSGDGALVPAKFTPEFVRTTLAVPATSHAVSPLGTGAAPVDPGALSMKSGRFTGVTDPAGVLTVPYPVAFPTALVMAQQIVGHESPQGYLVLHSTNKSQLQLFFPGAASVSRTVDWVAWGY